MGVYLSPSGLYIYERIPELSLYPQIISSEAVKVTPTVTGGCANFPECDTYNIFPQGPAAQVVRGAFTNLLYNLNADIPSFEGGTTGSLYTGGSSQLAVIDDAWHGTKCLEFRPEAGSSKRFSRGIHTVTSPGSTYTMVCMAKAGNSSAVGKTTNLYLYDDISGYTGGSALTLTNTWQQVPSVTKTMDASSIVREMYVYAYNLNGTESILYDALILVSGSTVPWFLVDSGTAITQTVPTASLPLTAGKPFTFVIYCGPSPWAGNDSQTHYFFTINTWDANNSIGLVKNSSNNLLFQVKDNSGNVKQVYGAVNASNWPVNGYRAIMAQRSVVGEMRLFLDRTELTSTAGTGTGLESSMSANAYLGSSTVPDNHINMPAHFAFFNRYITKAEWLAICDTLGVS